MRSLAYFQSEGPYYFPSLVRSKKTSTFWEIPDDVGLCPTQHGRGYRLTSPAASIEVLDVSPGPGQTG